MSHVPVLLQEVITWLAPQSGEIWLDATVNRGGHARALAERLGDQGLLIGLDLDAAAVREAKTALGGLEARVELRVANYRDLDRILSELGVVSLNGALFDLGLSSQQLEESGRGFSFLKDEPLAMTFSAETGGGKLTAREIVNYWREESLVDILAGWGEEALAPRIARAIVQARERRPIETSAELASLIRAAVPLWYRHGRLHPATRSFQALRIAVNDELGAVEEGLAKAWSALAPGGRLGVITFHSLEARLVKNKFRRWVEEENGKLLTKKAVQPSRAEVLNNPRARSSQLRVISKAS